MLAPVSSKEMFEAITPALAKIAGRYSNVPRDFSEEKFASTVADYAKDFAKMRVEPLRITRALEELARTAKYMPTFRDIMAQAYGEGWDKQKHAFEAPTVVWEEVINLTTGETIEVYPCICPGIMYLTRLEMMYTEIPDPKKIVEDIKAKYADKSLAKAQAAELSLKRGKPVKAGALAYERKPNVWGDADPEDHEELNKTPEIRPDLAEQIARMRQIKE